MDKHIYLDNAATTKMDKEVYETMQRYLLEEYANPSAVYSFASKSKKALDEARDEIAGLINADANDIYFTSGGSESDNWAIKGIAKAYENKGKHIITTKIEHHAVLHTCEFLEKNGFEVTYLDVDRYGRIDITKLKEAIRKDTILISIMFANNEIGTVMPVAEIGKIAKENNIIFHTDAVQAFGHEKIDIKEMNIDLLSASGHKINGPKGVGFLYIKKGIKISPLIHGGAQERNKRAGTHNVAAIAGFGQAAKLAGERMEYSLQYQTKLRDYLIERVLKEVPYSILNGSKKERLANNANFCFRFIEGESLLIMLDMKGIYASSGSACTSGSLDPSHVLLAIGLEHETAHGSLRLTISNDTTKEDIDYTVDCIKTIVERLRKMSPLYEDFIMENSNKECIGK